MDRLLLGFAERGHQVALVCGGPVSNHKYEIVDAGGTYAQYVTAPIICSTRFRTSDILIDVENGLPFFSPLWRIRPSICLVHHVHTDQWRGRFPGPVAALCQVLEARLMPAVYRNRLFVAISQSTAEALRAIGVPADHIRVIESGVDIPETTSERSKEPLFVSLNRLVPHKRIELLIDAWEIASKDIAGRLLIVGDGPELAKIQKKAAGVSRVEVVGRVSEETKHKILAEAWGLVSSAHHEGWGMSVMEAAALGTPTLALDAPGIRDAVIDGVTGVLVRGMDTELTSAMAREWVAFAQDGPRRERLGVAARERSRQFSWDQTIDRWLEVIEAVAERTTYASRPTFMASIGARALAFGSTARPQQRTSASRAAGKSDFVEGLRRSVGLLKGFRTQYEDPDGFYTLLADDTVQLVEQYHPIREQRVVDVGGGSGYFAQAFRRAGAESTFVEPFWEAMTDAGRALGYGVIGDGLTLPFADAAFDVSHSSNVIEHVTKPKTFFEEMIRIVRPGGLIFLAFTNWFSPFGGHETSPWHYLGGERAAERYEQKVGRPPKNRFGSSLFRLDISEVLAWARATQDADLIDTFPRYYPSWTKPLVAIPGVREIATWNLVIVMRRR